MSKLSKYVHQPVVILNPEQPANDRVLAKIGAFGISFETELPQPVATGLFVGVTVGLAALTGYATYKAIEAANSKPRRRAIRSAK